MDRHEKDLIDRWHLYLKGFPPDQNLDFLRRALADCTDLALRGDDSRRVIGRMIAAKLKELNENVRD